MRRWAAGFLLAGLCLFSFAGMAPAVEITVLHTARVTGHLFPCPS